MKKIAIAFTGTGKYLNFFPRYYETFSEFFAPDCEKHFFVFTDGEADDIPDDITWVQIEENQDITGSDYKDANWHKLMSMTIGGLRRFETLLTIKEQLKDFDWFVFLDGDMYCCDKVVTYEEFFNDEKDYFGVQHPTFSKHWSEDNGRRPFERDKKSLSAVTKEEQLDDIYLQGCVWGGKVPAVFELIEELDARIKTDIENDVMAVAHDESHLNRYRFENEDLFHILSPAFAKPGNYPSDEFDFEEKFIHSPANKKKILEGKA